MRTQNAFKAMIKNYAAGEVITIECVLKAPEEKDPNAYMEKFIGTWVDPTKTFYDGMD